jgi:hypothetical protein
MIQTGDFLYITNNIKLACALLTMGHKLKDNESCCIEENGKTDVNFIFDDTNNTVSMDAKKWKGGLEGMDQEEPMAYLWAYAHNRDRLLDAIKQSVPMVRVRSGSKILLYPKNASAEQKRRIMSKL